MLLNFLGYLGWLGASAATLKQHLFAVKSGHKKMGAGDPTECKYHLWILLNGLLRRAPRKAHRLGVTASMLKWLAQHIEEVCKQIYKGGENAKDRVLNQTMLVAALQTPFFFMMRMKEFGNSSGQADMESILRGCDVRLTTGGAANRADVPTVISISFRKTKADQLAFGIEQSLALSGDPFVCPVESVQKLRTLAPERFGKGNDSELPLFRWSDGRVLDRMQVQSTLQMCALACGLPPERFQSHSLRIGGATALYQATGEIELIKRRGRWSSDAVHRYLHDELGAAVSKGIASTMVSGKAGPQTGAAASTG